MKNAKCKIREGFSLVELMVVITIIALMSVAGVVGFGKMGDTMRTKEATGVITDTVKKAELEILKEDYKKSTIHFLSGYLVIVSEPENVTLDLDYGNGIGCLTTTEATTQNLIKRDDQGNLIESRTIPPLPNNCAEFTESKETGWQYQLRTGGAVSNVVRFIHFNLDRTQPSGIELSGDTGQMITIEAPYAKKTISDGSTEISLTVTSPEGHEEELTIQ